MAIAAAALKIGSMLAKTGGAIAKGGKMAMKKGGTVLKKSKKVAGNVKKAVIKRRKINKETLLSKDRAEKKKLERDKRKQEEELLEKRNNKEKRPNPSKIMKKGGGVLQRIISFISTVLVGWIVVNLPKIIESIKGVIKKIKDIYDKIVGFFTSFGGFFSGIRDIVGSTLNSLKNLDFSTIGENIKEKLGGLKNAFENMIANIKGEVSNVNSKKNGEPQKIIDSGFKNNEEAKSNVKKNNEKLSSKITVLKQETDGMKDDTIGLQSDFNKALTSAKDEFKKVGIDVSDQTLKNTAYNTSSKDLSTQMNNVAKVGKNVVKETSNNFKNVKADSKKLISKLNFDKIEKNITPASRKKTVFVNNMIPNKLSNNIQGKNQTQFIMIGKSLNSIIKENILLDAAYT